MPTDKRNRTKISGEVFKIRLDTADIMACVDAATKADALEPGMSLAQVVKWGIVVMAQTLRENRVLPERSPFEYNDITLRFKQTAFSHKIKTSIKVDKQEVELKLSERSVAIPSSYQQLQPDDPNEVVNGLTIPDKVKLMVPASQMDCAVITRRLQARDENITVEERAKWLLYAPARAVAHIYMTEDEIMEAEQLITTNVWPEYPSVLD